MNPLRRFVGPLLVGLLLAVPFFSLRLSMGDVRRTSGPTRVALEAISLVQGGASTMARAVSHLFSDYVYLVEVKRDNERLGAEAASLRRRVRELEAEATENRRLRKLLALRAQLPVDLVSAQVIGKDINAFFRIATIAVDRAGQAIRPPMPVIAEQGVVGQVQSVAGDRVEVMLAVDAHSHIDVVDEATGARGIVSGTGDQTRYACRVEIVERTDLVSVGDLLLTSGVGRAYPRGLPVARVTRVDRRDFGMFQTVEAEPVVDFSRLEEVLVMLTPQADEPPPTPKGKR